MMHSALAIENVAHQTNNTSKVKELRVHAFVCYDLDLQGNGTGGFRLFAHFGWPTTEYPADWSFTGLDEVADYLHMLDVERSPHRSIKVPSDYTSLNCS
jgi:hypothetical protein